MACCGRCGGGGVAKNAIKVKEEDSCGPTPERDTGDIEDEPTDIGVLEQGAVSHHDLSHHDSVSRFCISSLVSAESFLARSRTSSRTKTEGY